MKLGFKPLLYPPALFGRGVGGEDEEEEEEEENEEVEVIPLNDSNSVHISLEIANSNFQVKLSVRGGTVEEAKHVLLDLLRVSVEIVDTK